MNGMRVRKSLRWQERIERNRYNINDFIHPFQQEGRYGMALLKPSTFVPQSLFPYDERRKYTKGDGTIHFFVDDIEFEHTWLRAARPPHVPAIIEKAGSAITPDFSLYADWPLAVQVWQTYRTRLLGAFWQECGIEIIPSVSWSTRSSYSFCFDGIPGKSVVAIATMEIGCAESRKLFLQGLKEMIYRCMPTVILIYGAGLRLSIQKIEEKHPDIIFKRYPSRFPARLH